MSFTLYHLPELQGGLGKPWLNPDIRQVRHAKFNGVKI
jgi:hypothetical protein